ncbi:hypothetical protein CsatA_012124 [Cannabis sativa]
MAMLKVNCSQEATDDLYSLSQGVDDRYTSWNSCIINGVRFRCKKRDDKFNTQCSGVSTGGTEESGNITYYGVLLEILELDFIYHRKVFVFRCKWYNTDPRSKTMAIDHNLTSIDITSNWYVEDPFILADQAQQVFYLSDRSRGKNWMIVQKINHRNIFDVPEHTNDSTDNEFVSDPEIVNHGIFQEEESSELPTFEPIEKVIETSSLVRRDVPPTTLSNELIAELHIDNGHIDNREEDGDFDDNGRMFINDETLYEYLSEVDSDREDIDIDDD